MQFQPIFLSGLVESPLQDKLRLERQNVGFGVGESAVGVGVSVYLRVVTNFYSMGVWTAPQTALIHGAKPRICAVS